MEEKVNIFTDYQGNEIKEGMQILLISTKSPEHTLTGRPALPFLTDKNKFPFMRDGKIIPLKPEDARVQSDDKSTSMYFPEADEWRVILKYDVVWGDMFPNVLYAKAKGTDVTISYPLASLIDGLNKNQVIAIKGISDVRLSEKLT